MNRGHIAHCDSAASKHCAYSIHQQTASQQYHENHLAQQQHIFQINDQPMQQPLAPDDQQQQELELPTACKTFIDPPQQHSLGGMNIECRHCHTLHFNAEKLSKSAQNDEKFGLCCLQGHIKLPLLPEPPEELHDFLYGRSPLSSKFLKDIHLYNAAFAFTSVGVEIDQSVTGGSGP